MRLVMRLVAWLVRRGALRRNRSSSVGRVEGVCPVSLSRGGSLLSVRCQAVATPPASSLRSARAHSACRRAVRLRSPCGYDRVARPRPRPRPTPAPTSRPIVPGLRTWSGSIGSRPSHPNFGYLPIREGYRPEWSTTPPWSSWPRVCSRMLTLHDACRQQVHPGPGFT